MRNKRRKVIRKSLKYFKACCGIRDPLPIIADGTFLQAAALLSDNISSFVAANIGERCQISSSDCSIRRFRLNEIKRDLFADDRLLRIPCGDSCASEQDCVLSRLRDSDSPLILATCSQTLATASQGISAPILVVTIVGGTLILRRFEKEKTSLIDDSQRPNASEYKSVKRVRGVNPLSIKKKAPKGRVHPVANAGPAEATQKRKRKRSHGKKTLINLNS